MVTAHAGNPFGGATQQLAGGGGDGPFYVMMAPQELISHTTPNIRRTSMS